MNNRLSASPILFALAGSFLLSPLLPAAEPLPSGSPSASPPTVKPLVSPPASAPGDSAATAVPAVVEPGGAGFYTVRKGDSMWDIAHKFHTTVTKLKKLNGMKGTHIKPGQELKVPATKAAMSAPKAGKTASHAAKGAKEVAYRHAQPVQDFDLPASTFASCPPAPVPDADEAAPAPPVTESVPAVNGPSPELADEAPAPSPAPLPLSRRAPRPAVTTLSAAPVPPPARHSLFSFFYTPPTPDWGTRFTQVARELGNRNLDYDDDWCPPGESHAWTMDCSNTTRYLYKVTTGIQLPRTASDQYYYLHLQNKAWDVPQTASGFADCNYLRQNLKPGDLLFWENTYKPERQPPITHVMVYLGTNARGQWIMAGSQTGKGGEHNRRHGGPDIYVFDPTRPCGGYTTWMGLVHHQGRFCAYGRPLEADKAKLAVAAND